MAIQQVFGTPKACGIAIDYSGVFLAAAFSAGLIAKLIAIIDVQEAPMATELKTLDDLFITPKSRS
ncbi:hypothetical protein [Bosea beijingensis]|uniref:hypothetical protein n=1 Tax=Bosea beijingensis TaxID=3068632 RepID=UPI0027409E97|nr:hypothetical protein [Bosea sp. REN20]